MDGVDTCRVQIMKSKKARVVTQIECGNSQSGDAVTVSKALIGRKKDPNIGRDHAERIRSNYERRYRVRVFSRTFFAGDQPCGIERNPSLGSVVQFDPLATRGCRIEHDLVNHKTVF